MSFLTKAKRGATWLLNSASHGLHQAKEGERWLTKMIHQGRTAYRSAKHAVKESVPESKVLFDALEASPVGVGVGTAVRSTEKALGYAADGIDIGTSIVNTLRGRGSTDQLSPALRQFVYN
jgi:tryptophan synthase alpha subunit